MTAQPAQLAEAAVVRLRPGDVVVLRSSRTLSRAEADRLCDRARSAFDGHEVFVLPTSVALEIERDPELAEARRGVEEHRREREGRGAR